MNELLFKMMDELKKYKHDKEFLMRKYVEERLDKSFHQYNEELRQITVSLCSKHEKSLVKRLKKLDGKLDK